MTWKPYPASYGPNGVRLTGAQWLAYYGWLGHQHVPENDHGDPGDIDFARVLEHAKGTATQPTTPKPPPEQENDMAVARETADEVWRHRLPNQDGRHAGAILRSADEGVAELIREVRECARSCSSSSTRRRADHEALNEDRAANRSSGS
ncbi:hypothetical protein [Streptomyces sp. 6N223]|uniref:hypothetical protein n=1 Tax=Streptomyces sp. 6N223 TaxID=3457412 RepID=UPI003FD280FF